jgi:hypothetical protein
MTWKRSHIDRLGKWHSWLRHRAPSTGIRVDPRLDGRQVDPEIAEKRIYYGFRSRKQGRTTTVEGCNAR